MDHGREEIQVAREDTKQLWAFLKLMEDFQSNQSTYLDFAKVVIHCIRWNPAG